MMPNANNLALTLGTETGKTKVKNSKNSNVKKEDFFKLFGKTKKDEKKKTAEESGVIIPQFKAGINPFISKNLIKTEKITENLEGIKNNSKIQNFAETKELKPFVLSKEKSKEIEQKVNTPKNELAKESVSKQINDLSGKNLVENPKTVNTEMVLGKRIESTKSTNLKTDKSEEIKLTETVKEKTPANVQNLKKENFKGEIQETSKPSNLEGYKQTNFEIKDVNFLEVQTKGRNTNVFTKGNPLKNLEIQAKDDSNFVVSETKRTGPEVPTLSSYGLKKFNEGIKLEEKVEGIKELQVAQKNVLNEKLGEKGEILPLTQNLKNTNFERVEITNLNKLPQNTDFNNVMQQVENGIKINYNNQLKEMKIKLQPEELGEVEVKMTIENNIMKAEFVVESQKVKEILEAKFDTLRNALETKGFSGAEINVSVSTGDNKKSQNPFVFDEEKKGISITKDYNSKVENLENNSKINRISSSSGIDIMV